VAWLGAAAALMALWAFAALSDELFEATHDSASVFGFDRAVMLALARLRHGWLTGIAVDLTSLGSPTFLALLTLTIVVVLLRARDRRGAAQMIVAAVGGLLLTTLLKHAWSRPRPDVIPRLIQVAGFSYPSGHSLGAAAVGVSAAMLIARRLTTAAQRVELYAFSAALVLLVALSRVYLGVHYPSDVLGGLTLGSAWAIVVALLLRPRVIAPPE
jgi:undecaprenyl-diphosphatase